MKYIQKFLFAIPLILLSLFYFLTGKLIAPSNQNIGFPKEGGWEEVTLLTKDGITLKGWIIRRGEKGVMLLHGNGANRLQMAYRASFLAQKGYSVALFDFRSHGDSGGEKKSFGYFESHDAEAIASYMYKRMLCKKVAVLGVSLGGASTLLGEQPLAVDAFILEAVYTSIEDAVDNRMVSHFGKLGRGITPFLLWQLKPRIGISYKELQPLKCIKKLQKPLLMIVGEEDEKATLSQSKELFESANDPKEWWLVKGAGHVNYHKLLGKVYEERVLQFLEKWL